MIRYIKRFTGTRKTPKYDLVLQQREQSGDAWVDIDINGTWETPEQQAQCQQHLP